MKHKKILGGGLIIIGAFIYLTARCLFGWYNLGYWLYNKD